MLACRNRESTVAIRAIAMRAPSTFARRVEPIRMIRD
jgi:hypothetical protein